MTITLTTLHLLSAIHLAKESYLDMKNYKWIFVNMLVCILHLGMREVVDHPSLPNL